MNALAQTQNTYEENKAWKENDHSNGVDPDVDGVTGTTQVRLVELVVFGPAEGHVHQALLDDGVEPGQQEVQTSSLHRSLHMEYTTACHTATDLTRHTWTTQYVSCPQLHATPLQNSHAIYGPHSMSHVHNCMPHSYRTHTTYVDHTVCLMSATACHTATELTRHTWTTQYVSCPQLHATQLQNSHDIHGPHSMSHVHNCMPHRYRPHTTYTDHTVCLVPTTCAKTLTVTNNTRFTPSDPTLENCFVALVLAM